MAQSKVRRFSSIDSMLDLSSSFWEATWTEGNIAIQPDTLQEHDKFLTEVNGYPLVMSK